MLLSVPHTILAAAWIPFAVISLLVLVFSFIYIRYYQHTLDKELCSTLTTIFGLAVALITFAIVPVDISLVSYMKHQNGSYKEWAQDLQLRSTIENAVLDSYYVMFSVMFCFMFLILPLSYFYYEEGDEDTSTRTRTCTAVKYSIVFVLFGVTLFLIGLFVPFDNSTPHNSTSSEYKMFVEKLDQVSWSKGENALAFMISILSTVGMVLVLKYTGIGMASWPMDLIKGRRNIAREHVDVSEERAETMSRVQAIRNKYNEGARMSTRDRRRLDNLDDQQQLIGRRQHHLEVAQQNSCSKRCTYLMRPCKIILGTLFSLLAILIFISLLLTNIDKIMHSGAKEGYYLMTPYLPNILDMIFVFAQEAFPLDYLLLIVLMLFLLFASMGAMSGLGIRCCCMKVFKIRSGKTRPQALLFLCFILMYIVLALNILLYQMMPHYFTYGSQHYIKAGENRTLTPCDTHAGLACTMTRISFLLSKFFYRLWFFGAVYYWLSWVFLLMFVLAFVVTIIRKRRSSIEGVVDPEDLISSDDEPVTP